MNPTSNTQMNASSNTDIKNKKLFVIVPVRKYYETELTYDRFYEEFMPDKKDGESEEEYENRTLLTWKSLTSQRRGVLNLEDIDDDAPPESGDALDWGDAEYELRDICETEAELVESKMKREKKN